jgi:hypothetical protein
MGRIRPKPSKRSARHRCRDDKATETRFAEIKLRAVIKIGELSRELDKHQGFDIPDTDDGNVKTKTEVLEQAGINLRTAERYEELAGPREEQAQQAIRAAAEFFKLSIGSRNREQLIGFRL